VGHLDQHRRLAAVAVAAVGNHLGSAEDILRRADDHTGLVDEARCHKLAEEDHNRGHHHKENDLEVAHRRRKVVVVGNQCRRKENDLVEVGMDFDCSVQLVSLLLLGIRISVRYQLRTGGYGEWPCCGC